MATNKKVILITDDEAVIRSLLTRVLTEAGYEVLSAACGEEAIELARTVPIDLMLLDINMPGIGGIEALRQIRKHLDPSRIIMLTTITAQATANMVMELGVSDYLTKPIDLQTLKKAVQTHLLFAA